MISVLSDSWMLNQSQPTVPGSSGAVLNSWSIQLTPWTGMDLPATVTEPVVSSRLKE